MLKIFVKFYKLSTAYLVDKRQRFKYIITQTTSTVSGLNFRPATLKSRVLVISKLLTISSNCGSRCFQLCDLMAFGSSASKPSIV